MISDERNTMDIDVDVEQEIMEIITTNPVVEHLMGIAKGDFRMWNEALVSSKRLLANLFSLISGPMDHSVLSVSYGVDQDPSHEVMQVIGCIQEYEAQSANVMDKWFNYYMNRENLKGGLLQLVEHPNVLVNSDLHAAFSLLDQKMIIDLKADLSDLLNNYSVLMDILVAATAHITMHDDEDDFNMYM